MLTTVNVQSLNIQQEVLLRNKPKWKCMDDMKKTVPWLETATAKFELDLKAIQKLASGNVAREIDFCQKWVHRLHVYKEKLDNET